MANEEKNKEPPFVFAKMLGNFRSSLGSFPLTPLDQNIQSGEALFRRIDFTTAVGDASKMYPDDSNSNVIKPRNSFGGFSYQHELSKTKAMLELKTFSDNDEETSSNSNVRQFQEDTNQQSSDESFSMELDETKEASKSIVKSILVEIVDRLFNHNGNVVSSQDDHEAVKTPNSVENPSVGVLSNENASNGNNVFHSAFGAFPLRSALRKSIAASKNVKFQQNESSSTKGLPVKVVLDEDVEEMITELENDVKGRRKSVKLDSKRKSISNLPNDEPQPQKTTRPTNFPCEKCDKTFLEKARLQRHIKRMHDKLKRFFCENCKGGFFEKYDLKRHSCYKKPLLTSKEPINLELLEHSDKPIDEHDEDKVKEKESIIVENEGKPLSVEVKKEENENVEEDDITNYLEMSFHEMEEAAVIPNNDLDDDTTNLDLELSEYVKLEQPDGEKEIVENSSDNDRVEYISVDDEISFKVSECTPLKEDEALICDLPSEFITSTLEAADDENEEPIEMEEDEAELGPVKNETLECASQPPKERSPIKGKLQFDEFIAKVGLLYSCKICKNETKTFKLRTSAIRHVKFTHIGERKYKCDFCDKAFLRNDHLKVHINRMHKTNQKQPKPSSQKADDNLKKKVKKGFNCQKCGMVFPKLKFLNIHTIKMHAKENVEQKNIAKKKLEMDNDNASLRKVSVKRNRKCDTCKKTFEPRTSSKRIASHQERCKTYHGFVVFKTSSCRICKKKFRSYGQVLLHVEKKHPNVAANDNNDEKEANADQPDDKLCIICDKKFETAIDLNFHSIHHLIENKSLCNFCGVQCSNIDEMLQHTVMTHVTESVEFIKKQITQ